MAVEAELSLVLTDPAAARAALAERAIPVVSVYSDRYYDWPDRRLDTAGYEVRIRTITDSDGVRVFLTYKEPPVDDSGSKPEHETTLADPSVPHALLTQLGLVELIAFDKHCDNYRFTAAGRDVLATVVTLPDLPGQAYLEIETMAEPDDVTAALATLRNLLDDLGLGQEPPSTQSYTDRIADVRLASRPSAG